MNTYTYTKFIMPSKVFDNRSFAVEMFLDLWTFCWSRTTHAL